jgi:hypothetical protein
MKLILPLKALFAVSAAALLLSSCSAWHVTGETVVGGPAGYGNPNNVQNPEVGGYPGRREAAVPEHSMEMRQQDKAKAKR